MKGLNTNRLHIPIPQLFVTLLLGLCLFHWSHPAAAAPSPPPASRSVKASTPSSQPATPSLQKFHQATAPYKKHPQLRDPLWQTAWKGLISKDKQQRLKAIYWLSPKKEKLATDLLLAALQHPDSDTQWWALTALRPRQDARITGAILPFLRSKSVRLRLNATVALIQRKAWKPLQSMPKDASPLVREQLCRSLLKQPGQQKSAIQTCLRDRSPLVRLALARSMKAKGLKTYPKGIQAMVRKALQAGINYPFGPPPPRYSPSERLETAARQLVRYRKQIARRYRRASCLFARRYCKCLVRAHKRIEKQWQRFLDVEETYQAHRKSRNKARKEQLLSMALMAYRKGQAAYFEGSLCSQYQRVYRIRRRYRKFLNKGLFADQAPLFLSSSSLNFLRISLNMLFDTSYDVFRDDYHSPFPPTNETKPIPGPNSEALLQNALTFSYHLVFFKNLRLRAYNKVNLLLSAIQQRPVVSLDNDFQFDVLYRVVKRRFRMLLFLEENLRYTPSPPDDEGFPDHFVGFRLTQRARVGASFRWGNLSRQAWTQRNDWFLHLDYTHMVEWPLLEQTGEKAFARRMSHRWEADVSRQLFFFRVGLRNIAHLHQWLDVSAQLPTVQWNIYLTLAVGDTYDPTLIAQADAGVGFNLTQPLATPQHSAIPTNALVPSYAGEALYLRVRGFVAQIPLQWQVRYDYRAGPPQRPLFPFFLEHRVQAWIRVGAIRSLTAVYPRDLQFDVGLDLRFISYNQFQSVTAPEGAARVTAIPMRMGSFTFQMAYPFVAGFRGVLGNRLSVIQNDFRRFGDPNEPKTTNSLVLRNVIYIQLEYWFGGKHKRPQRTP